MTRTAIYARYSSNNQSEASIEDQIRLCSAHIEKQGWTLSATYTDAAMSGASTLRPGYQKLLEDARAGQFEIIVAEALDRLSRDQEDVAGLYKQLTFCDIKLITISEGEVSELHVGLKGTMNALYLKDLALKTHRGLEGRVRQGRSGGGKCYGYDVVRKLDADGVVSAGERRINTEHASTIRRIFETYAGGKSPRAIAKELNSANIPGPNGRPWCDSTIRGHHARRNGILNNELYIGNLVWNRQRFIKDPNTGKRLARRNPESEWVMHEVPHLRIINQELWDQAQARREENREHAGSNTAAGSRFWNKRRAKHLLTGIATCGVCGGKLASVGKDYLACSAARRQGTCANHHGIRRHILETTILDALRSQLMEPALVEEFISAFHEEMNRAAHSREVAFEQKPRELAKITQKLDGLIEAIADGLRSEGLQKKLDDLEGRKRELEEEVANPPPRAPRFHPNLAQLYRSKVEHLHQAIGDPAIHDEALTILRGLIEGVVIHPTEYGFEIELIGDIAKMIELPGKPGSSVPESFRSSVKVVAGTRNQRCLHVFEAWIPRIE